MKAPPRAGVYVSMCFSLPYTPATHTHPHCTCAEFGTWASDVHDSFSSVPFPIGSDAPTSEIGFNDLGSTKDVLMYYVNVMK